MVFHVSYTIVEDVEKFIQTVCYPGKDEESFTEIRVRLHKQTKTETSQSLPPEEMSMLQAIKCVHYQVFYSSRIDEVIISDIFCKIVVGLLTKRTKKLFHYALLVPF